MKIYGLDFTSAPSRKKPITCAHCRLEGDMLHLEAFDTLESFPAFEDFLAHPGSWVAGIDFPFGQPRKLVENLGWPRTWAGYVRHLTRISKKEFDVLLKSYRDKRPKGDKQHLRTTDALAGSKSPMMMYGVPVGKMFFEGAHRLLESCASILPCYPRNDSRIIVEAYPTLVANRWAFCRGYKSDEKRKQTSAHKTIRKDIIYGLRSRANEHFGINVSLPDSVVNEFIQDRSGDKLDAFLCATQAAWAYTYKEENYGIPTDCDLLEGWIVDPLLDQQLIP